MPLPRCTVPRPLGAAVATACLLVLAVWLASPLAIAQGVGTAFTYQGELRDQGQAASGSYDLQFRLYDSAVDGAQLGPVQAASGLAIQNGVFSIALDFGDQFTGAPRWLEMRVRRAGVPGFSILEPRTAITPTPYAQHADFVADNTIVGANIADDTITAADIQSGAIEASELATAAVTSAKLADGTVTTEKLAPGAVGLSQVDAGQVQARVTGTCGTGEAIRSVAADGSVTCAPFQTAPSVVLRTIDDQPNNVGAYNSIEIGSDGLPFLAYYDATATALKVAHCEDIDCEGVVVRTLDNVSDTGSFTDIAIGANGFPVIGYARQVTVVNAIALCADLTCSSAMIRLNETAGGDAAGHTGIAIGAGGRPITSFWDISARKLIVARCADPACSGPPLPTVTILEVGENGEYSSIAIGSDGLPVISYFAGSPTTALKVVKCTTDNCSGTQIITIVDNTADVGRFTSLAIGSDGFPVISYVDASSGRIKIAACTTIDCSAATLSFVSDPSNGLGGDTALAIGADGLPIVAYQNTNLASLKVAKCTSPDCSGTSIVTTLDDPENAVAGFVSIAIGTDGLPIIGYYDGTAGALKIAKCLAADCR